MKVWNSIKNVVNQFLSGVSKALGKIFGSRKMLLNIIGLAVLAVTSLAPETVTRAEQIGNLILAIVLVGTAGITVEDSVKHWANRPTSIGEALTNIQAASLEASALPADSAEKYKTG